MEKDLYFLLLNLILIIIFLGILLFFSCNSYPTNNVNGYFFVEGYQDKKTAISTSITKTGANTSVRSSNNPVTSYQAEALDVQYHDTIDDIKTQRGLDTYINSINVYDKSGNLVKLDIPAKMVNNTYYDPGSMRYDTSNFVPSYEDTVYFSKLTGLSYSKPIENTNQQLGGFCVFNKNSPENLEKACNKLDNNTCASTNCCVLLGGQKCVSGDENGPKLHVNYNDKSIVNPDKYFYNGKCYGNCVNSMTTNNSLYDYNPFSSAFPINTPESILTTHTFSPPFGYSPAHAPSPSPVQTSIPSPSPVQTSIPSPSPVQTSIPSPVQTYIPSPVQTSIPSPVQTSIPSPIQTSIPSPVQTSIPSPSPSPVQTFIPSPSPVQTTITPCIYGDWTPSGPVVVTGCKTGMQNQTRTATDGGKGDCTLPKSQSVTVTTTDTTQCLQPQM